MYNARIIIPYFGKLPEFLPWFLKSCSYNPSYNWVILSDREKFPACPENVDFIHYTQSRFDETASEQLGFNIITTNPYKLCDFKPAYGIIFREFLEHASFWGYCDLDMIFGRLNHFIQVENFNNFDILSFYRGFLSGPFSLFRNSDKVNSLFKSCKAYKKIFRDPEYTGFDENIYRPEIAGVSLKKIIRFLFFATMNPGLVITPAELRYQYQWHIKRRSARDYSPVDMTDAIITAKKNQYVKASFRNELLTDPYFSRINKKNWQLTWDEGKLTDPLSGKEFMAFHFQESKSCTGFNITKPGKDLKKFRISPEGIQH